ncbi:MAG: sulfurtransferase [Deltaproteobacteria bacterium]|nr:sulfurtransferase [Deltaproteobacteria bacterium]RLB96116.1 MAG: sulfurtransferase [Deltaproteobacteria bacterium]RLC11229.1 MAG: sulfurtransferase [Deltaproteobacteria bacterium]
MKQMKMKKALVFAWVAVFLFSTPLFAGFKYKIKQAHPGGDLTPSQAHEMLTKAPKHTFLVDCRTRPEYQLIGHPVGAYNIPLKFWAGKFEKKKYGKVANPNFGKDLLARFNPKTDTLIFMCRSGHRSCIACIEAVKAGFAPNKVFSLLGGFEGGKVKYKGSAFYGQRKLGGWRNEGLPWTYHIDKKLVYKPDLAK